MTLAEEPADAQRVSLNLNEVREIMHLGVRRAMAFLGSAQRFSEAEPPTSLALSTLADFRALPEPLSIEQAREYQLEFTRWVLGSALGELDRFLHLFLDQVWRAAEIVQHGPVVRAGLPIGTVEGETNSGNKVRRVLERLSPEERVQPHWSTLANARNALTHQAGRVTPSKAKHDGRLRISWERLELTVVDGEGNQTVLNDAVEPVTVKGPGGNIQVRTADVHVEFEIGEIISLTPQQMSEICFFYHRFADRVHGLLIEYCRAKGIPINQPAA